MRAPRTLLALVALALLASSCAYYNTFYLARKNYFKGTEGAPYVVDKAPVNQTQFFLKSVEYSKKLIANYPRSKWVDDAYLMWAKSLLAQNDPLQTVNMLQTFRSRYPDSPLRDEATFYLGVGYRQARRYTEALGAFDEFVKAAPKHALTPYALMERARVLMALGRPGDAATASSQLLERFPKSVLALEARKSRAEALYKRGDFAKAREDFRFLGDRALTDEDRLTWLLREADCLEGARDFDGSIALLRGAITHEREPQPPPRTVTPVTPTAAPGSSLPPATPPAAAWNPLATPGADRWGRLQLRIGTANLLAGRLDPALQAYQEVLEDYPRTTIGAEAQYRIGYAYETVADDFESARTEYGKVKTQTAAGGFADQATQRLATLDRLAQFRTAGGDSVERRAEAGFAKAEVYLFQLDKPDRALQEYEQLARDLKGTPYEAKALNAQAWVLSRRLDRRADADSLFWRVVRQHPATEAQLAARDYLEAEGADVPSALIKMPVRKAPPKPDSTRLTPPPATPPLGLAAPDSARAPGGLRGSVFGVTGAGPAAPMGRTFADSVARARGIPPYGPGGPAGPAGLDSLGRPRGLPPGGPVLPGGPVPPMRPDTTARGHGAPGAPADTTTGVRTITVRGLPTDTAADSAAAADTTRRAPSAPMTSWGALRARADSLSRAHGRVPRRPVPARTAKPDSAASAVPAKPDSVAAAKPAAAPAAAPAKSDTAAAADTTRKK